MALIRPFSEAGHSGSSAGLTLDIFNRLANFEALTPITNAPEEWMDVNGIGYGAIPITVEPETQAVADKINSVSKAVGLWQNRRDSSLFSNDAGMTYYSVKDEKRVILTAKEAGTK